MRLDQSLERRTQSFSGQRFRFRGATKLLDGTNPTFRLGPADKRAQVHQGRIKSTSTAFRNEWGGQLPDSFASSAGVDGLLVIVNAGEQARDVCIDDRHGLIKSESCDGVCGVTADTGKIANRGWIDRQSATMSISHNFRGGVQMASACIIAESLPGVQDVIFRGSGQGAEIGEPTEPVIIIWDHGSDLCLLEHELGDENGVRIAGLAPGKLAAVTRIPAQDRAPEAAEVFWRNHGFAANVQRSTRLRKATAWRARNVQRRMQKIIER